MRIAARAIVIKDNNLLVMHRNKFGQNYLSLIGGGVAMGEHVEQTLIREIKEEASLVVNNPRLVIEENAGNMYGIQYIYLCDYVAGEPKLAPYSPEAKINEAGKNLYQPTWLPLQDLEQSNLQPKELKQVLIDCLKNGFPPEPIKLTVNF